MQASEVQGLGPRRGRGEEPPPGGDLGSPASWASPGNPGAQPGGAARAPPTSATLWLSGASLKAGPKAAASVQCCQMTQAPRRHIATAPQGIPPESASAGPCLGLSFKLPGSARPWRPSAPHCLPAPTPGLRDPPRTRTRQPGKGAAQPRIHTQAHRSQKSSFRRASAEVITSRGAAIRVRPGDAPTQALLTVWPAKQAPGAAGAQSESLRAPPPF